VFKLCKLRQDRMSRWYVVPEAELPEFDRQLAIMDSPIGPNFSSGAEYQFDTPYSRAYTHVSKFILKDSIYSLQVLL